MSLERSMIQRALTIDTCRAITPSGERSVRSAFHFEENPLNSAERAPRRGPPDLDREMRAIARGDRAAFARLYDSLSPAVHGVARRVLRSTAHAEEVTQEVFLEVWRKAGEWQSTRGSAANWVMLIARARATDRVRSEQAGRDRQQKVAPGWVEPAGDTVDEGVTLAEEHDEIRSALASLTDKQRIVIELAYYEGKTYLEVAESLGLPLGTVKTRMRDALIRLRESYGVPG
jgi:RNA polymerase sigma-70 factor (ECF subfamily)